MIQNAVKQANSLKGRSTEQLHLRSPRYPGAAQEKGSSGELI